jgi:hypothetical protein
MFRTRFARSGPSRRLRLVPVPIIGFDFESELDRVVEIE